MQDGFWILMPEAFKEITPKTRRRHKWANKQAKFCSVRMECMHCGLKRDARFDRTNNYHWVAYQYQGTDEWVTENKTPSCVNYTPLKRQLMESLANAKGWYWSGTKWFYQNERKTA